MQTQRAQMRLLEKQIRDYFFAFLIKLSNNEDVLVHINSVKTPPESDQGLFLNFYHQVIQ